MRPTSHHPAGDGPGQDPACPPWCRREHRPDDPADDRLHQGRPAFVALVHGDPRFGPQVTSRTDDVVLRLVQRLDSTELWLEVASEEGGTLWLMVSAGSARRLADALADVLSAL